MITMSTLYNKTQANVMELFKKAGRVAVTCATLPPSCATFTVHFITDDRKLASQVLQTMTVNVH